MAEETKITLKAGLIITAACGLIVTAMTAILDLRQRVTVVETEGKHVAITLGKIEKIVEDIRQDQIRRFEKYEGGGK